MTFAHFREHFAIIFFSSQFNGTVVSKSQDMVQTLMFFFYYIFYVCSTLKSISVVIGFGCLIHSDLFSIPKVNIKVQRFRIFIWFVWLLLIQLVDVAIVTFLYIYMYWRKRPRQMFILITSNNSRIDSKWSKKKHFIWLINNCFVVLWSHVYFQETWKDPRWHLYSNLELFVIWLQYLCQQLI